MFEKVKNTVDKIVKEKNLPYMDVNVSCKHQSLLKYYVGDGVTGKEKLYMFSCTKPVTVVCVMQLVEQNKIKLTDDVAKYIKGYDKVVFNGEKQIITVESLLTMSAGLTYEFKRYPIEQAIKESNKTNVTEKVVESFASVPLAFPVGEKYCYSLCHDVLGRLVEVVSGMPLSEYMRENVFKPLNMDNTRFGKYMDEEVAPFYLVGEQDKVEEKAKINDYIFTDGYFSSGAGLVSTADDFIKFADMLACGGVSKNGTRIIKESTLKDIYSFDRGIESLKKGFACVQGSDYGYGLGLRTRLVETEWGLPVGEFGWDGAAGSYLLADPVNNISIFIGMHLGNWSQMFVGKHLEIVKSIYECIKNIPNA